MESFCYKLVNEYKTTNISTNTKIFFVKKTPNTKMFGLGG